MSLKNGVFFNDIHSYRDLGLILVSRKIGMPKIQTKMVSIPIRDGSLDMTEVLTNDVKYDNREIVLKFRSMTKYEDRLSVISEFANLVHGKKVDISFDDDALYHYVGRVDITENKDNKQVLDITCVCDCEPYKRSQSSADDWLWDPFDFETGIINNPSKNMVVDGSLTYVLTAYDRQVDLTVTSSASMTLTIDGTQYNIVAGKQKLYGVILSEGEHTFVFTGNGTVTLDYVGGVL